MNQNPLDKIPAHSNQSLPHKLAPASRPPLGQLPLTDVYSRRFGQLRQQPQFLAQLVQALLQADPAELDTQLYPWSHKPILLGMQGSKILVDKGQVPIDLSQHCSLRGANLLTYSQQKQHQAHLIYAGECLNQKDGQAQPVLVLTDCWQNYLAWGVQQPASLGPDGEQLTAADLLAVHCQGSWISSRILAEFEVTDSQEQRQWVALAGSVSALNAWHTSYGFDPANGQETWVAEAGWSRIGPDGQQLFPRLDPAVITAVTAHFSGQDRLLLGQASSWESNRFSTFAGFIEAGESAEGAVVREVAEECSGLVSSLSYRGSQPWPFPRSLMLGFRAEISNPHAVTADGEEIKELRWFSRDQLRQSLDRAELVLPAASSISRKLIEDFYGQPL
ncbi:MAG: NAD(+) diphosphatase [Rothia sp. (in: high G+C Gram-positive bacteria)]|nr:NAD(+) diphosphatase [Rothia sp. (in: high G+C Gram-positive bacteria)]